MLKKFKKGDKVLIISGSEKGKTGNIKTIDFSNKKVLVDGINTGKFHIKPTQSQQGSIVTKERPIHISNISHIDSNGKKFKIAFKADEGDGKPFKRKFRISKKTKEKI